MSEDYGKTRIDDHARSGARKFGRFLLWLFAIVGAIVTAIVVAGIVIGSNLIPG